MDELSIAFAKLSALHKTVCNRMAEKGRHGDLPRIFDPRTVSEYFEQYTKLSAQMKFLLPHLFSDLYDREVPEPIKSDNFEGRGYIPVSALSTVVRDIEYILTVHEKNDAGRIAIPSMTLTREGVFFAGQYFDALQRVQTFWVRPKRAL